MFADLRALSEARSTAGSKFSSSCCFGSSELAFGGDDHRCCEENDYGAEDQESCCVRLLTMVGSTVPGITLLVRGRRPGCQPYCSLW